MGYRKSLRGCSRLKTEELIVAIILEEGEDDDLLVYCMSNGTTDTLKKHKGHFFSWIGSYFMDDAMKCREFFSFEQRFPHRRRN
jgi:hypothetical protein